MGIDTRRPPLPAPTEDPSSMDNESNLGTEVATDISRRTDRTSYSIPEDGSPITITTNKKEGLSLGHHGRQKSQTSLLIEYFEAGKTGDKTRTRPSVRVKVTPSAGRKSRNASDAVQITGIGKDKKPSYTRRISLDNKVDHAGLEGTEVSRSSGSNVSAHPPVEVEILNVNGSDLSNSRTSRTSRDLGYVQNQSDISSMPPDSLLDTAAATVAPQGRSRSRSLERQQGTTAEHLQAPVRTRSRSLSRERITQKVMEKLAARPRDTNVEYEPDTKPSKERRRRSSRTQKSEDIVSPESSLLSSNIPPSQTSYRSGTSKVSLNNPRLLEMVEDTVRRLILPEINQIKTEQKGARNLRDFDESRRTSTIDRDSYGDDLGRRLSKSSNSPNISSKPKVVLNRYGEDPGEVLSRGDSERKKYRRSSRENLERDRGSRRSSKGTITGEETGGREKSKDGHRLRDVAAGGIAGGILTAAALRHHDSQGTVSREKRKKRSKDHGSRSRSASIAETNDEYYQTAEEVPPMPFGGNVNDSELTRESILSAVTERPVSRSSKDVETPVREVSRGAVAEVRSPATLTPSGTPVTARNLGSSHSARSIVELVEKSPASNKSISNKARIAALAAAGLGGAAIGDHVGREHDTIVNQSGSPRSRKAVSPAQSVSSTRNDLNDPLIPQALRPRSQASLLSGGEPKSFLDAQSPLASPALTSGRNGSASHFTENDSFAARTRQRDLQPESDLTYDASTPQGEDMEEWFRKQHEENERYRQSMAEDSNLDSLDDRRLTRYTEDSYEDSNGDRVGAATDVRGVGANPEYVHTPVAVESAVASLMEPSMISSVRSSEGSSNRLDDGRYHSRMAESVRELDQPSPAPHETEAAQELKQNDEHSPSRDRWSALRDQARALSARASAERATGTSPRQSETRSLREERSLKDPSPVQLGASGVPLAEDPMPEIGHGLDTESDVTNPSDIQGYVGKNGQAQRWSGHSMSPPKLDTVSEVSERASSGGSHHKGEAALVGAGAGAAAGLSAEHALDKHRNSRSNRSMSHRDSVDEDYSDERGLTPDLRQAQAVYFDKGASPTSPGQHGDEGYASAAYARSTGAETPIARQKGNRPITDEDMKAYQAVMGGEDDPFVGSKHTRHLSANSHGMASPLYDSSTGKGVDSMSKDVVALMDHLTVRDGQRNARDTEILVTLVRSAAEMRNNFEGIKQFIAEQNKINMKHTDRDADMTVQKVLGGPRPQPLGGSRTPRASYDGEDEMPTKRKNVFKRALKGLSNRNNNDLGKIEDMLNQLLDDVEILKEQQGSSKPPPSARMDSINSAESYDRPRGQDVMDSYERLRAAPDSGYEPDGNAGTSSTLNVPGNSPLSPRGEKQTFYSGYDGRKGSPNRVSTVLEEGEDDDSLLAPHEAQVLDHQFEDSGRYASPENEGRRHEAGLVGTPPRRSVPVSADKSTENTPDKQRKHKSNSSSIFGIAKLSRWSKTTSSSVPDNGYDARRDSQDRKAYSEDSQSGDSLMRDGAYYDDDDSLKSDDRRRSAQSLTRDENSTPTKLMPIDTRSLRSGSQLTRTPSPLIPDEGRSTNGRSVGEPASAPSPKLMLPSDSDEDDFEDPKYQAHRNSLLLQHPQPRPGPTHRHQTNLESQAHEYDGELGTDSDLSQRTADSDFDPLQWGSNPALSLARTNKLGGIAQSSPVSSPTGGSNYTTSRRPRDDGPLMPQAKSAQEPSLGTYQPAYNARMYYSSPLGSGHLLEPIEEVRYSLETDSGHLTPEPKNQPIPTRGSAGESSGSARRSITGPRPMGSRSPNINTGAFEGGEGTIRRRPVARSRESIESETF